ncbi:MAG: cold shock domain-containing protein, partial [Nitrosomonadales bacterium]|nr:cold shock domain-containing protein [Nitrosomonadales bacterium]
MRYQGKITKWNDEKGFGFVSQNGAHKEVFLHISSLHNRGKRPQVSQLVTFELSSDSSGRQQAVNVSFVYTRNQSSDFADAEYNSWFISYIFAF